MPASRKELCAPTALPHPFQVTLSGPSVFLPLPGPPLAGLFSVQQPQFGKLSSRDQGCGDPACRAARSSRPRAPGSILCMLPGAFTPEVLLLRQLGTPPLPGPAQGDS